MYFWRKRPLVPTITFNLSTKAQATRILALDGAYFIYLTPTS